MRILRNIIVKVFELEHLIAGERPRSVHERLFCRDEPLQVALIVVEPAEHSVIGGLVKNKDAVLVNSFLGSESDGSLDGLYVQLDIHFGVERLGLAEIDHRLGMITGPVVRLVGESIRIGHEAFVIKERSDIALSAPVFIPCEFADPEHYRGARYEEVV